MWLLNTNADTGIPPALMREAVADWRAKLRQYKKRGVHPHPNPPPQRGEGTGWLPAVDTALVETNRAAQVGATLRCPVCRAKFMKAVWNKVYCCDDCRAVGNGFPDTATVRQAMTRKRKKAVAGLIGNG